MSEPARHDASAGWRAWLAALRPAVQAIDARERVRVVCGVALGLFVAGAVSRAWAGPNASAWLMAPLGASAVLVFALPASPLAQPWAVVGGNTLSALAALAVAAALPGPPPVVTAVAAAAAVAVMLAARCLHPPGGAVAVLTMLTAAGDWRFAFFPVLANSALLVAAGLAYNRATGRPYPHPQREAPPAEAGIAHRITEADLDAVLARYNQVLAVPRDDLRELLEQAEMHAHGRRLEQLRSADVMTRDPVTVSFGTPLQQAWSLMHDRGIKALPVVDRSRRIAGIVTLADFMRAAEIGRHQDLGPRLRRLLRATAGAPSDKPEVVGQIMTRSVRVASAERSLAELVPVFSSTGHHHLPVLDAELRLVGMLTQTDVVRALLRTDLPAA